MPYALDASGSPLFFVSGMAMHTRNMREDPRVSLLITEGDTSVRVTLVGSVEQVEALAVSGIYLSRHQNARQWQDFADFTYYRLVLSNAYFIGGFGVMGWITAQQYQEQFDAQ